jgi:hypothetical protein
MVMTTMTKILAVHGIGNFSRLRSAGSVSAAADGLAADWASWLEVGARRAAEAQTLPRVVASSVCAAYYADALHRGISQAADEDVENLDADEQETLISWADASQAVSAVAQGERTVRAREAAAWLTRKAEGPSRTLVFAFVREVRAYLAKPESPRRLRARAAVAAAVREHRPDVVVAHSLGSVVTWETFCAETDLAVNLLVTIGSPLAMAGVVLPKLQPAILPGRGQRPDGVHRWVNLADVGDVVALPREGLSTAFDGVKDLPPVVLGGSMRQFHGARDYLGCPEVAAAILG